MLGRHGWRGKISMTTLKPMRFGLVGCGGIGNHHANVIKELHDHEDLAVLVAGADTNPAKRAEYAGKHGVEVYDSLDELLERDDLDAVAVCTPSGIHAQECIDIANRGLHILCEKPGDVRAEKVREAIDVAKARNVVFGGIFNQRFHKDPFKVKAAIERGYLGQIVSAHCETPWYRAQEYYDSGEWRGTWELDGGVLSNQAPHMIDRMTWLAGDVEEVISAVCETRDRNIEAETLAAAIVRLKGGGLATITGTTLAYPGMPQRVLICGTEGCVSFVGDELVSFETKRPFEYTAPAWLPGVASVGASDAGAAPLNLWTDLHKANYKDFILAVREGREPLVTGEDQYRVSLILNNIYQRAGVGLFA